MRAEGIGTELVTRVAERNPGLYIIHNSSEGEREFYYWRREAPARELFSDPTASVKLYRQLEQFDCVYLSGITLAILAEGARENLRQCLAKLRTKGVQIAFDSNYRPSLWDSVAQAQAAIKPARTTNTIPYLPRKNKHRRWRTDST